MIRGYNGWILVAAVLLTVLISGCYAGTPIAGCEDLKGFKLASCYANTAYIQQDVHVCDMLTNRVDAAHCYGYYAVKVNDSDICTRTNTPAENRNCLIAIELYYLQTPQLASGCAGFNTTCFAKAAAEKDDPEICKDALLYEDCYIEYVVEKSNASLCNNFSDKDTSFLCYLNYAIEKKNISICNRFEKEQIDESCQPNNETQCEMWDYKLSCYEEYAYATNNLSICYLLDKEDADNCQYEVAGRTMPDNW